ncbi:MAG: DUF58 domain-containing protein [Candidatus Kapabacteria bacterium]|nr:DUF58 domain-containing protein [Candidatus Kapabacteria bacterium]
METAELIKKVRKIEIRTRGLSRHIFSGEYHSAFKGKGMAFAEVREYIPGDEIRAIDWNVTARFNHPYIKVFQEERELTVMLLVDMSASGSFGTKTQFKRDLITELCAVMSFSAMQNNDKIGAIFFTNKIEKFIPPKKGKSHVLRIIRELLEFKPEGTQTNISEAMRYFSNVIKKKSIAFILSDFMDEGFEDALKIVSRKHDTVAMQVFDEREAELPNLGMIQFQDAETGQIKWVDTSSYTIRQNYMAKYKRNQELLDGMFLRSNIDVIRIRTDQSYVVPLMTFFKKRGKRA